MKRKRHSPQQVVRKLQEAQASSPPSVPSSDNCSGTSQNIFHIRLDATRRPAALKDRSVSAKKVRL